VNSYATVRLITGAFNATARGQVGRAEALRQSMLALIRSGGNNAHPSLWAPFVLAGEGAL
jgi:CHAT domain-containing protein